MSKVTGFKILLAIASSIVYLGLFSLIAPQASASNKLNIESINTSHIAVLHSKAFSLEDSGFTVAKPSMESLWESASILKLVKAERDRIQPFKEYLETSIKDNIDSSEQIVRIADELLAISQSQ